MCQRAYFFELYLWCISHNMNSGLDLFSITISFLQFSLFFAGDHFFSESILFWVKSYQVAFQHKCFYCLSSHSVHGGPNDILRARCIRHLESNVKEITHSESSKTTFSLLLLKVFLWFRISRFLHPKSNVFYKYNQYPDHIQKHIL